MKFQHQNLAAGKWKKLTLVEQLANVGSEIFRAISWQKKSRTDFSQRAFFRALELLDLSLTQQKSYAKLKELTRLRSILVDYFFGKNEFKSQAKDTWAANIKK